MFGGVSKFKTACRAVRIPTRLILPNPYTHRRRFYWDELESLAQSIHFCGLLQPITVREIDDDRYQLISGERRLRACKMAGLSAIPAIIINADDEDAALLPLLENQQRTGLNIFEEAEALDKLMKGFGMTQAEIAAKLGITQNELVEKLKILRLPETVRTSAEEYGLTRVQAELLLKLPQSMAEQAIDRIVGEGLSDFQTASLVNDMTKNHDDYAAKGKTVMVFKDIRIFINTLNHAVNTMRKSGIKATATKRETNEYIEYIVKIEK